MKEMIKAEIYKYLENYAKLSIAETDWDFVFDEVIGQARVMLCDKYNYIDIKIDIDLAIKSLELEEKFVVVASILGGWQECQYWLGVPDIKIIENRAIDKMLMFLNKEE